MADTNVKLSEQELSLVMDCEWMLVKRRVMDKSVSLLEEVQLRIENHVALQQALDSYALPFRQPKISKGENYRGFPYAVLDFPRIFERKHVFSIRSLFWWGHHFLLSLHLEGDYLSEFLRRNREKETDWGKGWNICIHEDPWQHYPGSDNFAPLTSGHKQDWLASAADKRFFRIAVMAKLDIWNDAVSWYDSRIGELADWLN